MGEPAGGAMLRRMSTMRIGAGAGYSGDRIEPAQALAERGALDVLVFECLAERTIALAQLRRLREPAHGYDPLLEARLRAVLPACRRAGTRIVTNMGAAHPRAAGAAAIGVARELGLAGPKVAVVTGDDVLDWVRENDPVRLETGRHVSELGDRLVSANAYLGADALRPALASDAEVIVTGRVSDPSLFVAPLAHRFGWRDDDWPRLGRGVLVGHLLECAAQVSGGYIADPGRFDVPGLEDVGFPYAEVAEDGGAVLAKLEGTGGRIDRLTCTAQLLYEIDDPSCYVQADAVADFSQVRFDDLGRDRVRVTGAGGAPRPDQLKATVSYRDGWIGEGQISYAGPGSVARGRLALQLLEHRLTGLGLAGRERRAELMGADAMHGPLRGTDRTPYEVRARLAVRCASRDEAEAIGREVEALYLNGPAGGGGVTQSAREVIAAESVLVPRAAVRTSTEFLEA
jgi:hypothetical protein